MEERFPDICGLPFPRSFDPEEIASAINYKPKPGDIFVASYPKCGTTWLQKIILLILRKGKTSTAVEDIFFECPFIEMTGIDFEDDDPKPLALKTHLPYHMTPNSKDAKYIYICRQPMDCLVSYYHHLSNIEHFTFDEFLELYFAGRMAYGDYLDHLIGWYKHKDDSNVLLLTYEGLKKDTTGEILKIAKFIGETYWKMLVEEPNVLEDVLRYSSFDYMKGETNEVIGKFWKGELDAGDRKIPAGIKRRMEYNKSRAGQKNHGGEGKFLRKGKVGDWKNYFSVENKRKLDELIIQKTANCDVMALWE